MVFCRQLHNTHAKRALWLIVPLLLYSFSYASTDFGTQVFRPDEENGASFMGMVDINKKKYEDGKREGTDQEVVQAQAVYYVICAGTEDSLKEINSILRRLSIPEISRIKIIEYKLKCAPWPHKNPLFNLIPKAKEDLVLLVKEYLKNHKDLAVNDTDLFAGLPLHSPSTRINEQDIRTNSSVGNNSKSTLLGRSNTVVSNRPLISTGSLLLLGAIGGAAYGLRRYSVRKSGQSVSCAKHKSILTEKC